MHNPYKPTKVIARFWGEPLRHTPVSLSSSKTSLVTGHEAIADVHAMMLDAVEEKFRAEPAECVPEFKLNPDLLSDA